MNVNPSSPHGPRNPADPAALESSRAAEIRRPETAPAGQNPKATTSGTDSVDVSTDARALAKRSEAREAKSSLPVARREEIGERLASGFYDQPEVIDRVANKIAGDPDFLGRE